VRVRINSRRQAPKREASEEEQANTSRGIDEAKDDDDGKGERPRRFVASTDGRDEGDEREAGDKDAADSPEELSVGVDEDVVPGEEMTGPKDERADKADREAPNFAV